MRRLFRSAALTVPFLLPICAADAPAGQVLYTNKRQQPLPLSNVGDPATIAKARLFVTLDNGKTWTLAHELQIAEGTKDLPKFPFSTDRDGAFGIMPCITFRNGQSEAEPKPGQVPPYVLMVDSTAPAVTHFDAMLVGRAAAKAVVRLTWSVSEANPEKETVAIEASSDGGARFVTVHLGGVDGAVELTVPVTADARDLQLRLVATDRARNVTVSPSRNLSLAPMPEPEDPKDALAKAIATLPTVAEVRVDDRPLPTTEIAPPSQVNPGAPVAPKTASGAAAATATAATPNALAVAATPVTPAVSARPDVVVAGKPYTSENAAAATPTADKPAVVVADNSIDQAYYEALAASRTTNQPTTNPKTAPRPVSQPRPLAVEPQPQAPARVPVDGQRPPASLTPVIIDDEIKALTDARILATTGHLDDACDLYERLRFGSLGKTALAEQVKLQIANERPRDALTAITSAPLEIVTDAVRIDLGSLLLAAGRADEVEAAVAGVAGDGAEARPALLLIAKAYRELGKTTESKRALEWLAKGKDAVAAEARALLGR
jgi:hypothetical protein